jgi:V/A-type H+-transporting ATPase subunit K
VKVVDLAANPEAFATLKGMAAIGAGLATGLGAIGAGAGEGGIGASVVGVVAEDRGFLGLGLVFLLIPETLVIFGLVISFILMFAYP